MGSAASAYAASRRSGGRKRSRGTRPIAASTRSSPMPRRRSWASTMRARSSADTGRRLHRARGGDAEVLEHGGSDVGDPADLPPDADGHERDEGVARDEGAVTAAAGVVTAAEVDELPALRGGDEQLARVRVLKRRARPPRCVRVVERVHGCVRSFAPDDHLLALAAERDVDRREPVEPARELRDVEARVRKQVDLPRAVRARHDDLAAEVREPLLQPGRLADARLAVVGKQHDRVALEELVRVAGRVEERTDRRVLLLERMLRGGSVRPGGVRGEVVAGEVEGEEVEAVARDEPAPHRRGVRVDRAGAAAARRAAKDEPYSTIRRSSRFHQTSEGMWWTPGPAPVAIEVRQTGVREGKTDVACR